MPEADAQIEVAELALSLLWAVPMVVLAVGACLMASMAGYRLVAASLRQLPSVRAPWARAEPLRIPQPTFEPEALACATCGALATHLEPDPHVGCVFVCRSHATWEATEL